MHVRKVCLFLLAAVISQPVSSLPAVAGRAGLSPNSMGTVSELANLEFKLLPNLSATLDLNHGTAIQHDLAFERMKTGMVGDIFRDSYEGRIGVAPEFKLGALRMSALFEYGASSTTESVSARVQSYFYPQHLSGYLRYSEKELSHGPFFGLGAQMYSAPFSLSMNAKYSPFLFSDMSGDASLFHAVQNTAALNAESRWLTETYSHGQGTGEGLEAQAEAGISIAGKLGIYLTGGFRMTGMRYKDARYDTITLKYGRDTLSSDFGIVEAGTLSTTPRVETYFTEWNAGLTIRLTFLSAWSRGNGYPMFRFLYNRNVREQDYTFPQNDVDVWKDDFGYWNLLLTWEV